jgi:hypothetical protein
MCVDYMISSKWILKSSGGGKQSVTSVTASRYQAAPDQGFVTAKLATFAWTIRSSATGYMYVFVLLLTSVTIFTHVPSNSIQNSGVPWTGLWGASKAEVGSQVAIGVDTLHEKQRWTLRQM